jgi:hypothetical protein
MRLLTSLHSLRFSTRTLLIAVTIICLYLACWIPTSTSGVRDVLDVTFSHHPPDNNIRAVAPLLRASDTLAITPPQYVLPRQFLRQTKFYLVVIRLDLGASDYDGA